MLDAAAILAQAEAKAAFADSDAGVRGNLERLVAALGETGGLSERGEAISHGQFVAGQANRLETLRWHHEFPEIAAERIEAPVFLMGLPRSGTTYFQYLFDRDPRFRLIRTWQSMAPNPPPGHDPASVIARREAWVEAQKSKPTFKGFEALHLYDEDGSDECHAFMEQSLGAAGLHNLFRVPAYFDWLIDGLDLAEAYRVHKRQLQALQWKQPAQPWALKYPNHCIAMDAILEVYPDARFVMTHRDPVQALASIAKMTFNLRGIRTASPVDPREVGRDMLHFIDRHVQRIMAFDAGPHGHRVVHVDYYALIADPVGQMRRIHAGLGIGTPEAVARSVGDWHAANPKNARGANEYTLEQWGIEQGEALERLGGYMERFAIPRESEGLARHG